MVQNLGAVQTFSHCMHGAEVLHVSFNLNGNWKITPSENELVNACETLTFPFEKYAQFAVHLPHNMPAGTRISRSKRYNRLYESHWEARASSNVA